MKSLFLARAGSPFISGAIHFEKLVLCSLRDAIYDLGQWLCRLVSNSASHQVGGDLQIKLPFHVRTRRHSHVNSFHITGK